MNVVANEREGMRKDRMKHLNNPHDLRPETKGVVKNLVDNLSLEKLLAAPDLKDKLSSSRTTRATANIYVLYVSTDYADHIVCTRYIVFRTSQPFGLALNAVIGGRVCHGAFGLLRAKSICEKQSR